MADHAVQGMAGWNEMPKQSFKQKMLDPKNRRSTHIEDRRSKPEPTSPTRVSPPDSAGYPISGGSPDINKPIEIELADSSVSNQAARVDRVRSELSKAVPYVPTRRRKKR